MESPIICASSPTADVYDTVHLNRSTYATGVTHLLDARVHPNHFTEPQKASILQPTNYPNIPGKTRDGDEITPYSLQGEMNSKRFRAQRCIDKIVHVAADRTLKIADQKHDPRGSHAEHKRAFPFRFRAQDLLTNKCIFPCYLISPASTQACDRR